MLVKPFAGASSIVIAACSVLKISLKKKHFKSAGYCVWLALRSLAKRLASTVSANHPAEKAGAVCSHTFHAQQRVPLPKIRYLRDMDLKRLTTILPLFGVLLVILGYLKLYLYYDHWDIPIIDYLDVSQITLLFLSDVHIIISFVAIFIFPLTIGLAIITYLDARDARRNATSNVVTVVTEVVEGIASAHPSERSIIKFWFMIICCALAAILIVLFFCFNKIWLLYLATFNFMQFALIFCEYVLDDDEKLSLQITFVATTTAFSILVAHYDICKTEQNPDNIEVSIITADSAFKTSNNNLYLGKTNDYIFLYDQNAKTSRTIKTELVKEIKMTKKVL